MKRKFNTHVYECPAQDVRRVIESNIMPLIFGEIRKEGGYNFTPEMIKQEWYQIDKITFCFGKSERGNTTFNGCLEYELHKVFTEEEQKEYWDANKPAETE